MQKWRNDCLELCGALTTRLMELAEFLDSLLTNKDVLKTISQDRRKIMRRSVDNSLDISKSFRRMSLSMTGANMTLNDTSLLAQLTSLTDVLHNSMAVCDEEANNKENLPANQVDRRSSRLDVQHAQSESEDWSEPDRQVSHERIGLDGAAMVSFRNSPLKSNQEPADSSNSSNSDPEKARRSAATLRLQSRIADLERQLTGRNECNAQLADQLCEQMQKIQQLEAKIKELEQHEAGGDGDELVRVRSHLLESKELELLQMQQELKTCSVDLRVATMKMQSLQEEIVDMKQRHDRDIDQIMQEQRTHSETAKTTLIERHRLEIQQNYVHQSEHQLLSQTVDVQRREIARLERLVQELNQHESELKEAIVEGERKVRSMKKSLDEVTLAMSAGVLERRKLLTERNILQQSVERMENFSPDLGIESDAGCRTSGSDNERQNRSAPAQLATTDGGRRVQDEKKRKYPHLYYLSCFSYVGYSFRYKLYFPIFVYYYNDIIKERVFNIQFSLFECPILSICSTFTSWFRINCLFLWFRVD